MGNSTITASGTSMASPHAAGCAALFMAAGVAVTPDQIEDRLKTSPTQVYNPKNGLTFPRIDCSFESIPLLSVDISGPISGFTGDKNTFIATTSPITATQPITYVWQATEQPPVTIIGGPSNTISYTWEISGTKSITITAENIGSQVVGTYSIYLTEVNSRIYLPTVFK
jgi:subtilisin family serine protease